MKSKYDIARLHKDCVAWCENPTWKPWMVEDGLYVARNTNDASIEKKGDTIFVCIIYDSKDSLYEVRIKEFAHFIGLDVESYRLPEDRDQAVRGYLASIEEGAPLWEGSEWVKETIDSSVYACCGDHGFTLIGTVTDVRHFAYTFLRLDLREDGK